MFHFTFQDFYMTSLSKLQRLVLRHLPTPLRHHKNQPIIFIQLRITAVNRSRTVHCKSWTHFNLEVKKTYISPSHFFLSLKKERDVIKQSLTFHEDKCFLTFESRISFNLFLERVQQS